MSRGGGTRELRIVGGRWRSRRLRFLDLPGLRPTPDRVRETLFNWLQFEVPGRHVLDLFAGSGALGFEALSRGAASLTLVERDARQAAGLRDAATTLAAEHCQVLTADSERWLRTAVAPPGGYGLILLDPPFHQDIPARVLALLAEKGWLNAGVWVYVETEQAPDSLTLPPALVLHRQTRAGLVHALLYHVADAAEAPDTDSAGQGEKNRAGDPAGEPA
ncbi:UNVERIFIED_CONTAM: rsmD [Trichonephila clavipes]